MKIRHMLPRPSPRIRASRSIESKRVGQEGTEPPGVIRHAVAAYVSKKSKVVLPKLTLITSTASETSESIIGQQVRVPPLAREIPKKDRLTKSKIPTSAHTRIIEGAIEGPSTAIPLRDTHSLRPFHAFLTSAGSKTKADDIEQQMIVPHFHQKAECTMPQFTFLTKAARSGTRGKVGPHSSVPQVHEKAQRRMPMPSFLGCGEHRVAVVEVLAQRVTSTARRSLLTIAAVRWCSSMGATKMNGHCALWLPGGWLPHTLPRKSQC